MKLDKITNIIKYFLIGQWSLNDLKYVFDISALQILVTFGQYICDVSVIS